jgi:hypothetical protein
MLTRWIENNRRIRKIEDMFNLLTIVTNETLTSYNKTGIEKIRELCKRK